MPHSTRSRSGSVVSDEIVVELNEDDLKSELDAASKASKAISKKKPEEIEEVFDTEEVEEKASSSKKKGKDSERMEEIIKSKMRRELSASALASKSSKPKEPEPSAIVSDGSKDVDKDKVAGSRERRDNGDRDRSRDRDRDNGDRRLDNRRSRSRDRGDRRYRDRGRDHGRDHGRDRDRDRSRSRSRDRYRNRDRDRYSSRRGDRYYRDREDGRDGGRYSRRSRSRSRSRSRDRGSRDKGGSVNSSNSISNTAAPVDIYAAPTAQVSMRDVLNANPEMSMQDAIAKMNLINTAIVRGGVPPPLAGAITMAAASAVVHPPPPPMQQQQSIPRVIPFPGTVPMSSNSSSNTAHVSNKIHRDVFVGNLPQEGGGMNLDALRHVLTGKLLELYAPPDGQDPVVSIRSAAGNTRFCFMEMRTLEDANTCIQYLNGMQIGAGTQIKVSRPRNWQPATIFTGTHYDQESIWRCSTGYVIPHDAVSGQGNSDEVAAALAMAFGGTSGAAAGAGTSTVPITNSTAIMLTNLPLEATPLDCQALLATFGTVVEFASVVLPGSSGPSAVCRYSSLQEASAAMRAAPTASLRGVRVSVQSLSEQQAASLLQRNKTTTAPPPPPPPPVVPVVSSTISTVIRLRNMVTEEDLTDAELHQELVEDVQEECAKFGELVTVIAPTRESNNGDGNGESDAVRGVGLVFVQYRSVESAQAALKAIVGRKFNGQRVEGECYPQDDFEKGWYSERAKAAAEAVLQQERERQRQLEQEQKQEQNQEQEGKLVTPAMELGLGDFELAPPPPLVELAPPPPPVAMPMPMAITGGGEGGDDDMD